LLFALAPQIASGLYPPLAVALLATWRIDPAAGLRRLLYHGKTGAIAFRAFVLGRLCGLPFHLIVLRG
jgi:hypothetical protein